MIAPDGSPRRSACGTAGAETTLAEFLGRRIVVVFNPARAYLDLFSAETGGLNERDMVVLAVLPSGHPHLFHPPSPPLFMLTDTTGRVAAAYGAPPGEPFCCLIGKDGTLKRTGRGIPAPSELFESVDAMPMRRQEMEGRG